MWRHKIYPQGRSRALILWCRKNPKDYSSPKSWGGGGGGSLKRTCYLVCFSYILTFKELQQIVGALLFPFSYATHMSFHIYKGVQGNLAEQRLEKPSIGLNSSSHEIIKEPHSHFTHPTTWDVFWEIKWYCTKHFESSIIYNQVEPHDEWFFSL